MKYYLHILCALLVSCSVSKNSEPSWQSYYLSGPTKHVYPLIKLTNQGYEQIKLDKVRGITIDVELLHQSSWKDKMLGTLKQCDAAEYVYIKYPSGFIENDFSRDLAAAFNEMDALKKLRVQLDSAGQIPNFMLDKNGVEEFVVHANYITNISTEAISSNKLKLLGISCITENLNVDWSQLKTLVSLYLGIDGEIKVPNLGQLKSLRQLSFSNDQIDELPDKIFDFQFIQFLSLNLPKLKELNESLGNLTTLEYLSIRTFEIDKLPNSLSNLQNLKWFGITTTEKIKSIEPLTSIPRLESLSFYGINPLELIEEILRIKKLKRLEFSIAPLYGQNLASIEQLEKLSKIEFRAISVVENNGGYRIVELEDSVKNEIYNQLEEVLPKHFSNY